MRLSWNKVCSALGANRTTTENEGKWPLNRASGDRAYCSVELKTILRQLSEQCSSDSIEPESMRLK